MTTSPISASAPLLKSHVLHTAMVNGKCQVWCANCKVPRPQTFPCPGELKCECGSQDGLHYGWCPIFSPK